MNAYVAECKACGKEKPLLANFKCWHCQPTAADSTYSYPRHCVNCGQLVAQELLRCGPCNAKLLGLPWCAHDPIQVGRELRRGTA